MDIGEYLDSLEERTAKQRERFAQRPGPVGELCRNGLFLAAQVLPSARKSVADLYIQLDGFDKALQRLEAVK